MTYKSHDLHVIWPTSHMTYKSHNLQVTCPASPKRHMTYKSHDLQVTGPTCHITYKSHDLQVTWPTSYMTWKSYTSYDLQVTGLYHTCLSPCLIQRRSGHWESSLMGYSTLPTWVMPLVVRTTGSENLNVLHSAWDILESWWNVTQTAWLINSCQASTMYTCL